MGIKATAKQLAKEVKSVRKEDKQLRKDIKSGRKEYGKDWRTGSTDPYVEDC